MSTIETIDDTNNVENITASEMDNNRQSTADQKSEQVISPPIPKSIPSRNRF